MWGEGKVEEWEGREEELGLVYQKGEVGKKTIQNKQEIILVVFEKESEAHTMVTVGLLNHTV